MEYFNWLSNMLTSEARCTRNIKFRITVVERAFSKKKILFTSKLDLTLREKLVKCCIWSTDIYGAEI
jgi:hypothetical protein